MAKRRLPLSEQLGILVTALGNSIPIPPGRLKSAIMALIADAQNLEGGHGAAEAEAQVAILEAALKKEKKERRALRKEHKATLDNVELDREFLNRALEAAQAENRRLRAKEGEQQKTENEKSESDKPSKVQHDILLCLKQYDSADGVEWIVQQLGLTRIAATHHMEVLCDKEYVKGTRREGGFKNEGFMRYAMAKKGRSYLAALKLI